MFRTYCLDSPLTCGRGGTNATNERTDKTFRSLDNNRPSPIGIRTSSTRDRRHTSKMSWK